MRPLTKKKLPLNFTRVFPSQAGGAFSVTDFEPGDIIVFNNDGDPVGHSAVFVKPDRSSGYIQIYDTSNGELDGYAKDNPLSCKITDIAESKPDVLRIDDEELRKTFLRISGRSVVKYNLGFGRTIAGNIHNIVTPTKDIAEKIARHYFNANIRKLPNQSLTAFTTEAYCSEYNFLCLQSAFLEHAVGQDELGMRDGWIPSGTDFKQWHEDHIELITETVEKQFPKRLQYILPPFRPKELLDHLFKAKSTVPQIPAQQFATSGVRHPNLNPVTLHFIPTSSTAVSGPPPIVRTTVPAAAPLPQEIPNPPLPHPDRAPDVLPSFAPKPHSKPTTLEGSAVALPNTHGWTERAATRSTIIDFARTDIKDCCFQISGAGFYNPMFRNRTMGEKFQFYASKEQPKTVLSSEDNMVDALYKSNLGIGFSGYEVAAIALIAVKNGGIFSANKKDLRDDLRALGFDTQNDDIIKKCIDLSRNFQDIMQRDYGYKTGNKNVDSVDVGMRLKRISPRAIARFLDVDFIDPKMPPENPTTKAKDDFKFMANLIDQKKSRTFSPQLA